MSKTNLDRHSDYRAVIKATCAKIAPSWSLENMVAVNPYMGMADRSFSSAANAYQKMADIDLLMPVAFYVKEIKSGKIVDADIDNALRKNGHINTTVTDFIKALETETEDPAVAKEFSVKTVAQVLQTINNENWSSFILDRISSWASSYFDKGQAAWKTAKQHDNIYEAWRADALVDRAPKIMGLKDFNSVLKSMPNNQAEAIAIAIETLGFTEENLSIYLHAILLKFGGWSSYIAGIDWDNNLYGGDQSNLESFIAVLLTWEVCLLKTCNEPELDSKWKTKLTRIASAKNMQQFDRRLAINLVLQDALDFSRERELITQFDTNISAEVDHKRPKAQAVFCIDVRSEIYRRQLEQTDKLIETIGFAGFFGFPINYKKIGHALGKNQCPALISAGPVVQETLADESSQNQVAEKRNNLFHIGKNWKKFKTGAISGFSFVSPMGLLYMFKLISDSFSITRPSENPNEMGLSRKQIAQKTVDLSSIDIEDQAAMAKGALTGMGLTNNFAPLVLITGHGSDTVNNPHAAGLDCGACGGHSGEGNAMTAEIVLNNPKVRDILAASGIKIPVDTYFVAALHNTTTDNITILSEHLVPSTHKSQLIELKRDLAIASSATRHERSIRFEIKKDANKDKAVLARSKDWSTVRPEWGLAGCSAFIIAPRNRTANMSLQGKSFLHNYNWKNDKDFGVLEAIMTAPMVVTSWINLQYFASTVDNKNFGSGNKTLHNVTGGFGVLEGGSGDLRIGLPMQSIHDGEKYQHKPYRLNVLIEAPKQAINKILTKHQNVKALFDNNWINLLALNSEGKVEERYNSNLNWETVQTVEKSSQVLTKIKNRKINA
ncbi:MAG: YbcC family protein [Crocinitomicaceae bacterium]